MFMKNFLLSVFILISFYGFSQTIPNPDFENWTSGNPDGWQNPNSFTQTYGAVTVTQESASPQSGSYSVKLETKSIFGYAVTGLITNGQISVNLSNTPPITIIGGTNFTERPNHLKGYFKYTPATGDYCSITALLLKKNTGTNQFDTIGVAQYMCNTAVSSWTEFDAPFSYGMGDTPDTIQVVAMSSNPNAAVAGSILYLDHLYFEGGTMGNQVLRLNDAVQVYPNPANDILNVYFGKPIAKQAIVNIFNATGQQVKQDMIPANTQLTSINIYNLRKGLYFVQVQMGKENYTKKISVY